jgi:hypothetical protein
MGWLRRLRGTFRSSVDADLNAEIRYHLEARTDEYMRDGMTSEDARDLAVRRFGDPMRIRERVREIDTVRWAADIVLDVRHAADLMRRAPWRSVAAAFVLALAVGANAVIFSAARASSSGDAERWRTALVADELCTPFMAHGPLRPDTAGECRSDDRRAITMPPHVRRLVCGS